MTDTKYKNTTIKLGERPFGSFQGEALHAGTPSIWIRFFSCNLQCDGFGQENPKDPSSYELPYKTIDISSITRMEDLPVFSKGCDSSYSWSKKYRHLCPEYTIESLVDEILRIGIENLGMCPDNFTHKKTQQPIMLCFTGGEPLLQQDIILDIFKEFEYRDIYVPKLITIETNGTVKLKEKFKTFLAKTPVHFACSPKLFNVSGEKNAIDIDNLKEYSWNVYSMILKFVVDGRQETWNELEEYVESLKYLGRDIWVMPLGATVEQQNNVADIVNEGMKRGYLIATRNHCYVYGNKLGT